MTSSRANRRLASLYYNKVMNRANLSVIPKILNEDFVFTIPTHPEVFRGIEGFSEEVTGLHGAFPDVHLNVHHLWCFDDLILGLWTGTGTHTGSKPLSTPNGPLAATGNSFLIEGVSWIRADGVILRENLANEDTLKIIHDLGVKDCSALYRTAAASVIAAQQFPVAPSLAFVSSELLRADARLNHPLLLDEAFSRAQILSFLSVYWSAFSDVQWEVTHSKRSNRVVAYRWTFEAVHTGNFFSLPATNRRVKHQGVTVSLLDPAGQVMHTYINENLIVLIGQMS